MRAGRHFAMSEFDCHDGSRVPLSAHGEVRRLVGDVLDPLRDRFGSAQVLSGYRTDSHNRAVGGAARSFHRYLLEPGRGVAADVVFALGDVAAWVAAAEELGTGGIGTYARFMHVDTRHDRSRWTG